MAIRSIARNHISKLKAPCWPWKPYFSNRGCYEAPRFCTNNHFHILTASLSPQTFGSSLTNHPKVCFMAASKASALVLNSMLMLMSVLGVLLITFTIWVWMVFLNIALYVGLPCFNSLSVKLSTKHFQMFQNRQQNSSHVSMAFLYNWQQSSF